LPVAGTGLAAGPGFAARAGLRIAARQVLHPAHRQLWQHGVSGWLRHRSLVLIFLRQSVRWQNIKGLLGIARVLVLGARARPNNATTSPGVAGLGPTKSITGTCGGRGGTIGVGGTTEAKCPSHNCTILRFL